MPRILELAPKVNALREFHQREGRAPTCRECLTLFGYASTSAVHRALGRLEETGYLRRDDNGRISLGERVTGSAVRVGDVADGLPPFPAVGPGFSVERWLTGEAGGAVVLRVDHENEIASAHLQVGDLLMVDPAADPGDMDLVLAQVGEEWRLGRYREAGGARWLEGRRPGEQMRVGHRGFTVHGRVTGLVRKW